MTYYSILTFLDDELGLGERKERLTWREWPHSLQTQLSKRSESQKDYHWYLILKNKRRKYGASVSGGMDVIVIIMMCQQKIKSEV